MQKPDRKEGGILAAQWHQFLPSGRTEIFLQKKQNHRLCRQRATNIKAQGGAVSAKPWVR